MTFSEEWGFSVDGLAQNEQEVKTVDEPIKIVEFRENLFPRVREPFDDGDVIKFDVRGYTFAALRASGSWYVTGNGHMFNKGPMSYKRLVEALGQPDVSGIEWAFEWRGV